MTNEEIKNELDQIFGTRGTDQTWQGAQTYKLFIQIRTSILEETKDKVKNLKPGWYTPKEIITMLEEIK